MQGLPHPDMSEQRMTEIVEMLVERITSMEVCISSLTESIDVVKARVLSQDSTLQILKHTVDAVARRQRRDITGRECAPKGMICGINGRAVDLQIHHGLDTATTVSGEADDVIIVMSDTPLGHPPDSDRERVWESVMPWKWDADVRAAWGNAKYTRVRTECARLYRDKGGGFRPSCAELGLAAPLCGVQSGHHHLDDELHEVALRQRIPGLLVLGSHGVAVQNSAVRGIVDIIDQVSTSSETPLCHALGIYNVAKNLQPLALAILRGFGVQREFQALDPQLQAYLTLGADGPGTFFTSARLKSASARGSPVREDLGKQTQEGAERRERGDG